MAQDCPKLRGGVSSFVSNFGRYQLDINLAKVVACQRQRASKLTLVRCWQDYNNKYDHL